MFAGLDALNFIHPSRRSDLQSVGLIMIYMLNNLDMPLYNGTDTYTDDRDMLRKQLEYKRITPSRKMIGAIKPIKTNTAFL